MDFFEMCVKASIIAYDFIAELLFVRCMAHLPGFPQITVPDPSDKLICPSAGQTMQILSAPAVLGQKDCGEPVALRQQSSV